MGNREKERRAAVFFRLKSLLDDMVELRDQALVMAKKEGNGEYIKAFKHFVSQAEKSGIKIADQMVKNLPINEFPSFEEIEGISLRCCYLNEWFKYVSGHFDGVTGVKLKIKQRYKDGPGAASRQVGRWTLEAAEKVLLQHGGIDGYYKLPHGEKGPVRDKIAKAIKDTDGRNVYNVLKKLRNPNLEK